MTSVTPVSRRKRLPFHWFSAETLVIALVWENANYVAKQNASHAFVSVCTYYNQIGMPRVRIVNDLFSNIDFLHRSLHPKTRTAREEIKPRKLGHPEWFRAVGLHEDSKSIGRYVSRLAESFCANLSLVHVIAPRKPNLPIQLKLDERVHATEEEQG